MNYIILYYFTYRLSRGIIRKAVKKAVAALLILLKKVIMEQQSERKKRKLNSFQWIIIGFLAALLAGAVLLTLPISSKSGEFTPFCEALFTSTSAICVTGLVVRDTATHWSWFGQAVILLQIQMGGLGVITIAMSLIALARGRITLKQQTSMQDAFSAPEIGSVSSLLKFILIVTFSAELIGALVLMPAFCRDFGAKGVWMALFHAVSAFCNAGFDLMGTQEAPYQSLTAYAADPLVNVTVMCLIVFGGIGFLTLSDIRANRFHVRKYKMQTKLILILAPVLILIPALVFFFAEYTDLPMGERVLYSLFQSVTTRTAGFNTTDLSAMSGGSQAMMIFLMLVGASPASTAGGMKITTLAVLFLNAFASVRRRDCPVAFGRRISDGNVKTASTILLMYLCLFLTGGIAISWIESLPVGACLFETASALGTVGLTLGITPTLSLASQIILILFMFFGRVGGLTLFYATFSENGNHAKYPLEGVVVG